MCKIEVMELTQDLFEEALAVFRRDGWEEDSLRYVEAEMKACLNGDILGYIRSRFIVAVADGCVIGAAAWAPSMCGFAVYELSWATVVPEWRHRGVNRLMLKERVRQIRKHHGPGVFHALVCTWDNAMYRQAGFAAMPAAAGNLRSGHEKCLLSAQFGPDDAGV